MALYERESSGPSILVRLFPFTGGDRDAGGQLGLTAKLEAMVNRTVLDVINNPQVVRVELDGLSGTNPDVTRHQRIVYMPPPFNPRGLLNLGGGFKQLKNVVRDERGHNQWR